MKKLKPWARGPLELIHHAEGHLESNSDFDRRMALISFDNAIELAIITFLSLNPLQRSGWEYEKAQVAKWQQNFHSKLEFLEHHVTSQLKQEMLVGRDELIYYHSVRNELYHNGNGFTPNRDIIEGIRAASHWIFSVLFGSQPNDHLKPQATEAQRSTHTGEVGLSSTTLFLQSFIEMKKLLGLEGSDSDPVQPQSLLAVIRALVNAYPATLSEELVSTVEKAESIRDAIIDGKELAASNRELDALSIELQDYSSRIDATLRAYQLDLVEKAVTATIRSIPPSQNRRAGVIYQATGTGMSQSVMSYIAHARQIPGLERAPFVIVGNEQVLLEQFRQRLLAHSPGHPAFRTSIPESSTVLLHELSAPTPGIILTTPGKLRALRTPHEEHCLLIGLYLHRMQPDLNTSLPNATLIGFTNGPPLTDDTFGEPVASFGLNQAIAAGLLSPLILGSRQLQVVSRKTSNAEPTSEDSPHTSVALSILEDIKACSMPSGRKVIVVADKASGARAIYGQLMELLRVSDSPAISSMTLGLASRLLDDKGRQVINHFNNDSTSASVLVIPGDMLMGMDLLDVDAAYITARVNPTLQHKIASLPGRKGALPEIRVVDFGGNNWSVPLMHNLPNNPSP